MSARTYSSRRRRVLRPWAAYGACVIAGLAIGLAGSVIEPGPWFGPADAFARVERPPAVGDVLCVDDTCAYVIDALPFGDDRVAVVQWLRGRSGREALRVSDCSAGTGIVHPLADERRRQRWQRDGSGVLDRVATAACGPAATS
ncbi:MAG: hypothetical protein MUE62_06375 [Burkholderiaceae bacterium]|jgi:hypothetical protein|nr:hypothetical protein [Burkholderiaceae bacterium]